MLVLPLADKPLYCTVATKGVADERLFSFFLSKFFVDVLKSSQRIFSLEHLIENFLYVIIILSLSFKLVGCKCSKYIKNKKLPGLGLETRYPRSRIRVSITTTPPIVEIA